MSDNYYSKQVGSSMKYMVRYMQRCQRLYVNYKLHLREQ